VKPWRLTRRAEGSVVEIFAWTLDRFGERQAIAYRDTLIERINMRGVKMEQHMSEDYLRRLNEAYTDYFHHYEASPVLIINTEQLNPISREEDFNALIQQIAGFKGRRSYFNAAGRAS
jgi:plasmid stabilization system protein ParE